MGAFLRNMFLQGKNYYLVNICCTDAVLQALAAAYYDSLHYRDFLATECENELFSKIIEELSSGVEKPSTYKIRANMVVQNQDLFKITKLIDDTLTIQCEYDAAAAVENIFKIKSSIFDKNCPIFCTNNKVKIASKTIKIHH